MKTIWLQTLVSVLFVAFTFGQLGLCAADCPSSGASPAQSRMRSDKAAPTFWQIEDREDGILKKPSVNVKWQAKLGSHCISNPVIANGLVWVGTNNQNPRDPAIKKDTSVLMCFRESDGKFLWQYVSPPPGKRLVEHALPRLGKRVNSWAFRGVNCSPLVDGNRLYFTTDLGEVVCLDVGPLQSGTGEPKVLWTLEMKQRLKVSRIEHGCRGGRDCSIVADQDWIYVTTNQGRPWNAEKVPNPRSPSLICLEKKSGTVVWSDNSPGKEILDVQWSSPLIAEVKGKSQVIVGQGDGWVRAFEPKSGKLLWKFDTNPKSTKWNNGRGDRYPVLATPVFYRGKVYVGNGLTPDRGPAEKGRLYCIDPTKTGDVSPEIEVAPGKGKPNPNIAQVWCFAGIGIKDEDQLHGVRDSVGVGNGLVIAPDGSGWIHCLDAKTGKKHWTYDALADLFASPLVIEDKVYVTSQDGSVFILALSKTKKLLAMREDAGMLRTSPVFANGSLYLADSNRLTVIRGTKDPKYQKGSPGN